VAVAAFPAEFHSNVVNGDGVSDTESQIKLRRIFFDLKKRNYCDCDLCHWEPGGYP